MYPIDFVWRAARHYPDRAAIICPEGETSHAELAAQVIATAGAITQIAAGSTHVGAAAGNSKDHVILILSILAAGKVWIPLNPRLGDGEIGRIVEFIEDATIICDDSMMNRLLAHTSRARHISEVTNVLRDAAPAQMLPMGPRSRISIPAERAQAIKFTGGTTGVPKGVMQPLRAWNTSIVTQLFELGLTQQDRFLVAAPLTHGTSTYVIPVLACGGAIILPGGNSAAEILDIAERSHATLTFVPPTRLYDLLGEQRHLARDLGRLRYLIYGGASMPQERIREAQTVFGPVVCTSYGQTEAPQIITFLPPSDMVNENLNSVGRPTLLTKVAIVDEEGLPLPDGQEGEISVRGDLVMTGYLRQDDETRRSLRDGWLRTGDIGLISTQGLLYIRGRVTDVIISGGFNVYPGDVECALARHPAVADCAAFGVPHPKWGEAVHAAVEQRKGFEVSIADLIETVKRDLGSVKAPKEIHLFEVLPRSAVGKVLRRDVRAEVMRRLQADDEHS